MRRLSIPKRMVRRENAGRLKTAKIPVRGAPVESSRAVSGSASGSAEASEAQDQSQLRGMSLLDKIIAAVFASIPLGQKVPFEVYRNLSEKSQEVDIPIEEEEHYRILLEAQLRIRHEWEADFEYIPLHEFDEGVNSSTDSESEGEAESPASNQFLDHAQSTEDSDSGSDGWRARGGDVFTGEGADNAPDPDDSDFGYNNEGGEFSDDDEYD